MSTNKITSHVSITTYTQEGISTMEEKIREISKRFGIDLVGVADLSPAREQLAAQGGTIFESYPRAVSLGCRLPNEIVEAIADHGNRALIMNYIHHVYSVVNQRLDQAALSVAGFLMEKGYLGFPVPASQIISFKTYTGLAPHKTAAHLSGLGWIGRSALLVTKKYGPRVRFVTVYTDAPLPAGHAGKKPLRVLPGMCRYMPGGRHHRRILQRRKIKGSHLQRQCLQTNICGKGGCLWSENTYSAETAGSVSGFVLLGNRDRLDRNRKSAKHQRPDSIKIQKKQPNILLAF